MGKLKKSGSVLLLLFFVSGCIELGSDTEPEHLPSEEAISGAAYDPAEFGDDFEWASGSPILFIDHLIDRGATSAVYTIVQVHEDWVSESDVSALISLLDSDDRCAAVVSVHSSDFPTKPSTVGAEAAYLIEGFRKGRYPPSLGSMMSAPDKNEIQQWWSNRTSEPSETK